MGNLSVIGNVVRVEVTGWRKLLTFISRFDILIDCIVRAGVFPPVLPRFQFTDRRTGGASITGWFALDQFSMGRPRWSAFLDLRLSSQQVVVLDLRDSKFDRVMVEVEDARQAVAQIDRAGGPFALRDAG